MSTTKDRYVCILYDVCNNVLKCVDNRDMTSKKVTKVHLHDLLPAMVDSPKAESWDATKKRTNTPLHAKSSITFN